MRLPPRRGIRSDHATDDSSRRRRTRGPRTAPGFHRLGSLEDEAESELIHEIFPELALAIGAAPSTLGGNEHTTFVFAGENAREHAAQFETRARELSPNWWYLTRSTAPRWR